MVASVLAMAACGSDGTRGSTPTGQLADAAATAPDSSVPTAGSDAGAKRDGRGAVGTGVEGGTPAAGDATVTPAGDASLAGDGAASGDSPFFTRGGVAPTTGPVSVNGTVSVGSREFAMMYGMALYDPTDSVGQHSPELRIYLSNFPFTDCDPTFMYDGLQGLDGRAFAIFPIIREKSPPYPFYVYTGKSDGQYGSWLSEGSGSFVVDLTSGDDGGGEQVVGTIKFTASDTDPTPTGVTIQVHVNHCGTIETTSL
jgi:hypothetical protein